MCKKVVITEDLCPICSKEYLRLTEDVGRFGDVYPEYTCPRCLYRKSEYPDGKVMHECVDYYTGLNPIKAYINTKAIKKFYQH